MTATNVAALANRILVAVQAKMLERVVPSGTRRAVNKRPVTCKVVAVNIQSVYGAKKRGIVVVSRIEVSLGSQKRQIIFIAD
jgi:hypothetical protein